MPTVLSLAAVEGSTFVIEASLTDENGVALVPNTLTWTLTDRHGTIVNSRFEVAVTPPVSDPTIVLQGADLALVDPKIPDRVITFEGTYNTQLGSNLPLRDEVRFKIVNLVEAKGAG